MKSLKSVFVFILLFAVSTLTAQPASSSSASPSAPSSSSAPPQTSASQTPAKDLRIDLPGSPFGIAAGFLYGYQGVKPYEFMPQLRQLGSGFTKVYLFWNQVEPEKGKFDWTAVDKFTGQLKSPE